MTSVSKLPGSHDLIRIEIGRLEIKDYIYFDLSIDLEV
jgi:hypothetical protein